MELFAEDSKHVFADDVKRLIQPAFLVQRLGL